MVSMLPPLAAAAIENFYLGWRPPLLAIEQTLSSAALVPLAQEIVGQFARIMDHLRRHPSPRTILDLARTPPNACR